MSEFAGKGKKKERKDTSQKMRENVDPSWSIDNFNGRDCLYTSLIWFCFYQFIIMYF
jgi:hypothetical protein